MICNFFDWDLQEILKENIEKLEKRYPDGFTIKDASREGTRVDWNEKNEYLDLFENYFLKTFSSRLSEYTNPKIEVKDKKVLNK